MFLFWYFVHSHTVIVEIFSDICVVPSDSRNFTLETDATEYPSFLTIEKSHVVGGLTHNAVLMLGMVGQLARVQNVYFLYASIVFGITLVPEVVAFTFKTVLFIFSQTS